MRDDAARLLRYLKYSGWTALGTQMGSALVEAASGLIRLRERGFNQADLLAKGLGLAMHAEVETLLERRRADRSQAKLARRERMINVHRQFQAIRPAGPPDPPVLLVDDVVTTGATAAACTTALTAAGWTAIGLVSFARAWRTLEPAGNSPLRM
jgi:predicted amidophosphoribosyltransferase